MINISILLSSFIISLKFVFKKIKLFLKVKSLKSLIKLFIFFLEYVLPSRSVNLSSKFLKFSILINPLLLNLMELKLYFCPASILKTNSN